MNKDHVHTFACDVDSDFTFCPFCGAEYNKATGKWIEKVHP